MHIKEFLKIPRDIDIKKGPLYNKVSRSPTWKNFSKERAAYRKYILQRAKEQKIRVKTGSLRRRFSAIHEEVINGYKVDEAIVVKSKRLHTLRVQNPVESSTTALDVLKDSRSARLANITDGYIETPKARNKLKKWLKSSKIVAVTLTNLKWLVAVDSPGVEHRMKTKFTSLLDMLIGTEVVAANFGENPCLALCDPLVCLKEHITKYDGPIRRYYLDDINFPRHVRQASNFVGELVQKVGREKEDKVGVWMKHAEDRTAWDAVAKSNAQMGRAF
eukprot:CAMPEP_0175026468 /NCGR_PEP_ID=MMETSP0005-20121125/17759_1 /TAXON_ID=420556 /ORGANISM="Ochromonas sp., Strain CCMP1393" /LENGTH=274 /DNA_ID=CAMNT_0016285575 /DNA_START=68 /DNA_END=889 /DNA_ORIENTATION=+